MPYLEYPTKLKNLNTHAFYKDKTNWYKLLMMYEHNTKTGSNQQTQVDNSRFVTPSVTPLDDNGDRIYD